MRRARLVVLALVVAYFFLPYDVRYWIPAWVVFLVALALEVQFFVGGYLDARRGRVEASLPDRGPQARDLADLGGDPWHEVHVVGGHLVPTAGLTDEEADERIAAYLDDPEAELARIEAEAARPAPVAGRRIRRRHVLEAVAVLAAVAGILVYASRPHGWDAVSAEDAARAEALFSRQASLIARHDAQVRCDTGGTYVGAVQEADGIAIVGGSRAYVTPGICDALYQLAFKDKVQSFSRTARAIAVLAHEAWHLRGVADEGLANCYGFQSGVRIGVALGLSEGTARSMMRQQLANNAADSGRNVDYVVPKGCSDGGRYDLNPSARGFP
jgi:hypothetical protein